MSQRLNFPELATEQYRKLFEWSQSTHGASIDQKLIDLVNIRASQINGCAFCVDMHIKEAKIHGERDLRVHHVTIWRESTLFSERERAAFEWAEEVTKLGAHGVEDEIYQRVRKQLSEKEITDLTFVVAAINAWNRLAVSFRATPGSMDKMMGLDKAGLN